MTNVFAVAQLFPKGGKPAQNAKMKDRTGSVAPYAMKNQLYGSRKKTDMYADARTEEYTDWLSAKRQPKQLLTGTG